MTLRPAQLLRGLAVAVFLVAWALLAHFGSAGEGSADMSVLLGVSPFMAAVGAVHASLKALREGVAPGKLPNIPPPDLVKDASRETDYGVWSKDFLGGGGR